MPSEADNKSAPAAVAHSTGTMMTTRERPSSTMGTNSSNSGSAWFAATFGRSFGIGGEMTDQNSSIPNCVYANWPSAQKVAENRMNKTNKIFVTITSKSAETSENKESSQKTVHLQLEQDKGVERRILSIPAHILRWIGFKSGDEVAVQLNNDLGQGFTKTKEDLPPVSCTISRVQIQVQLAALREFSKLSLQADSLADYFRQTFLHDVLNVGQCCLLEFECATLANGDSTQQNAGRKRKCVEMKAEMVAEDDLEPPQHKKGLAASAFSAFLGWTGFDASTPQKYTIEAKILALYRPQPKSIASDEVAQFGLMKEGTQIVLCPVAESGLCLYGDPAIINSTVSTNADKSAENGVDKKAKESDKKNAESIKLSVHQFGKEMRCSYSSRSPGDDYCLIHHQDFNVVTKKFSEEKDGAGSSNTHIQLGSVKRRRGLRNEKINVLIRYKMQEDSEDEKKSNETDKKERQIVLCATNSTENSARGVRGKIFMSHELIEDLKLEIGDEVTVQSFDQEKRMAQKIKLEIEECDRNKKCPATFWGIWHPETTLFFHVNDIANSFKKNYSGKTVNLNITTYLQVENKELKNRKKKFKTNMFDQDDDDSACLIFRIKEIQACDEEKIDESKKSSAEEKKCATCGNAEKSSFLTVQATEKPSTTRIVEKMQPFSAEFATIKKGTVIEITAGDDSKLTLFGIDDSSANVEEESSKVLEESDLDFGKKIGGLDEQLGQIFRRAFSSRMISADISKQMGVKHIRGILLHGPPGTGKTLIARELAKALKSREPKIINGAEVQSMWLGQSEKNVRSLFVDAEREQALAGDKSRLHVIVIDELDALCPNRQFATSGHRTEQRIVNTLLAKLDGVEQLNNILLIGMTNLIETIDPALLRPGRLELKIRIGLPNEKGRKEILDIHTNIMREAKRLHEDVDLANLAMKTVNFSGAELEGLVRAAQSQAIQRIVKSRQKNSTTNESSEAAGSLNDSELKICAADFELAFEDDIEPAFGKGSMDGNQLKAILCREPILWSPKIEKLLEKGKNFVEELRNSNVSTIGQSRLMLLNGPMQSGKTFLATTMAKMGGIPYIRLVTADSMLNSANLRDQTPTGLLDKIITDCENCDFACIIFDEIEQIIGYNDYNGHGNWRHTILQKLAIIFNRQPSKEKRLLLLATSCEDPEWFEQMQLHSCLQNRMELPTIGKCEDVMNVLGAATKKKEMTALEKLSKENGETKTAAKLFTKSELDAIAKAIGPLLHGNAKTMPTIKDLAELVDWHLHQNLVAENNGGAIPSSVEEQSTAETENATEASSSPIFDKFKQQLLKMIVQKRVADGFNGAAHLSMYR